MKNKFKSKLIARLWAMSGPAEGCLVYGLRVKGDSYFHQVEGIQCAVHFVLNNEVDEVREFWVLPQ